MNRKTSIFQAILAAVLFGASAPLAKPLLGTVDPIPLAALLYLGSGIAAWILLLGQRASQRGKIVEAHLTKTDLPWLVGAILAGGVAAPIILLWGLNQTPASTVSLLLNFEAVATTLIAVYAFREAVDRRILLAMGAITLASVMLTWTVGAWGISVGALGVLGACVLWGLDNNLTRHISAKNPLIIVGIKGLGAGIFSLILAIILGKSLPGLTSTALALLLGAVCYGLSIYLFILALRGLGAARTSTLFGLAPFVGAALSLVLLQERPQALFWAASLIMVLGAWLMLTERHDHHHIHEVVEHNHAHLHPDDHHRHDHLEGLLPAKGLHCHPHVHDMLTHRHAHAPDIDHRHEHSVADGCVDA